MDLVVGRVVKAHGVTGEFVVDVRTDDPEEPVRAGSALRGQATAAAPNASYVVESVRAHGGRLLVRVHGVADRDAADALRGTVFVVDSADLPPIEDPDEFYDHQLEGLTVRTVAGSRSARSPRCCTPPAANCSRCARKAASAKCWCRSSPPSSPRCRWPTGRIEIDPPEGLLEMD